MGQLGKSIVGKIISAAAISALRTVKIAGGMGAGIAIGKVNIGSSKWQHRLTLKAGGNEIEKAKGEVKIAGICGAGPICCESDRQPILKSRYRC